MANQQILPAGSFFRALFEQEAVGVAQIDTAKGRFVRVNQRCCDIVGYGPGEMRVLVFQAVSHPEDYPAYLDNMARLTRSKTRAFTMQMRCLCKDGSQVWVNLTVSALWPVGDPARCHLVLVEDITERRLAEEALQESESLIRSIGNNLPNCMLYQIIRGKDGSRRFAYVSEAVRRFYDCSPAEAMADAARIYSRVVADDQQRVLAEEEAAYKTLATFSTEARLNTPAGGLRWSYFASSPRLLEDGATCWDGIEIDITDRKQAEEALRVSEENYRVLFEMESDAIFLIDNATGRILQANPAACALYGYSQDELLSLTNADLSAEPQQTRQVTTETMPAPDTVVTIPLRWHRKKDGTRFDVEITGRFFVRDGWGVHIAAIRDITGRKALEDQLVQAQKMESVGRLAGGVAHDFNNMLQTILGFADLALAETPPESAVHGYLLLIKKAGQRSADLTRQLLAFARKQTVSPKVLDLNDTVAGMLKMLHRLIGEDVDLIWKPGANLWAVSIDPAQVDQIVANLAVNARDAIAGVGQLTIETQITLVDDAQCLAQADVIAGHYVLLAVSDNGCGMGKDVLDHLFEPFFTTKEVGKGTGLGLATVYGIVKQNNGLIEVHSEPGKGATFKIFLPRAQAQSLPEPGTEASKPVQGSETVLLVEDDEAILHLGTAILEKQGYTVLAAERPGQALALLQRYEGPVDLVITDVVMPEMNGKDLAE